MTAAANPAQMAKHAARHWHRLPDEDAAMVHAAAFEAWAHPTGATLVLLFEATRDDPSVGCWVWQLDTEHDMHSHCSGQRTPPPFEWALGHCDRQET